MTKICQSCKVIKYYEGRTTVTQGKIINEHLDFPQVMFCVSSGFKSQVLLDEGLHKDFLSFAQFNTHYEDKILNDIEELWDNATYSSEEFAVTWTVYKGIVTISWYWRAGKYDIILLFLFSDDGSFLLADEKSGTKEAVNSYTNGKCWLWKPKLKAKGNLLTYIFYVQLPPNEWD